MPDLLSVFHRYSRFILLVTVAATTLALLAAIIAPKEYVAVATALPANSMTIDKARIFNSNVEQLYSEIGTADELDRLEGTALLDTLYIATANAFSLDQHYGMVGSGESRYKAAMELKGNSKIQRSAYGEIKVRVWDEDRNLAAALSNDLMKRLEDLHTYVQNQNNIATLSRLQQEYSLLQDEFSVSGDSLSGSLLQIRQSALAEQLQQYQRLMIQYNLALKADPNVLLVVEPARPPLWHDRPKVFLVVIIAALAALITSFLIALYLDGKRTL